MPKKKGGKKGRGKKSKSQGKDTGFLKDHVPEFMMRIKIESYKQSINQYRYEYTKYKEEMKQTREAFEDDQFKKFTNVKYALSEIDNLENKHNQMDQIDSEFQNQKKLEENSIINGQRMAMNKLHQKIEKLENEIDFRIKDMAGLIEFRKKSDKELQSELDHWMKISTDAKQQYELTIDKMVQRHDVSVKNNAIRTERTIDQAEGVASAKELSRMPAEAIAEERLNRRLKEQLKYLYIDEMKLSKMVEDLEIKNMELVKKMVAIDWDLRYEKDCDLGEEFAKNLEPIPDFFGKVLPPLREERPIKFKTMPTKGTNLKDTAKEIITLELIKRRKQLDVFGIKGNTIEMQEHSHQLIGPMKYYKKTSDRTILHSN
ncbi:hypothetical protein HDV02_003566 [Globomyces sp. JEL0801]|nr:hypothetical protein HDV02_003566 [Globomyces sp. JEL0801]